MHRVAIHQSTTTSTRQGWGSTACHAHSLDICRPACYLEQAMSRGGHQRKLRAVVMRAVGDNSNDGSNAQRGPSIRTLPAHQPQADAQHQQLAGAQQQQGGGPQLAQPGVQQQDRAQQQLAGAEQQGRAQQQPEGARLQGDRPPLQQAGAQQQQAGGPQQSGAQQRDRPPLQQAGAQDPLKKLLATDRVRPAAQIQACDCNDCGEGFMLLTRICQAATVAAALATIAAVATAVGSPSLAAAGWPLAVLTVLAVILVWFAAQLWNDRRELFQTPTSVTHKPTPGGSLIKMPDVAKKE